MMIQPNKAIVGSNAFAHESGIHQDGVLKHKSTYEIINPDILGLPKKDLVLGKHSGRNAFKTHIEKLIQNTIYKDNIEKDQSIYEELFVKFKKLADNKKSGVTDSDLFALLDDIFNIHNTVVTYHFVGLTLISGSDILSTATVSIKLEESGETITDAAIGHGPVNAIFNAINRLVGISNVLSSYEVKAVSEGSDSPGQVVVRLRQENGQVKDFKKLKLASNVFSGRGMDEDILVASAKAYLNAVNRMMNSERRYLQETRNVNL